MNFGSLIGLAKQNKTDSTSVNKKCFSTAVSPAMKPVRSSGPSPNVRAFLAKQDKEQREKKLAAKKEKDHLLELRAQNSKNNKKAKIMASRTKDNDFSKIRLMTEDELEAKKKREVELQRKELTDKVERMKARIQLEERDAELPHKRKRKKRTHDNPEEGTSPREEPIHHVVQEQHYNDAGGWKSTKPRDSGPPVKKKKLPPTQQLSFQELLKVAAEKQNQSESGESESEEEAEDEDPNRRPMTKKDLQHYRELEMRRKGLSVNNLPKIRKKAPPSNKNQVQEKRQEYINAPPNGEHPRMNGNVKSVRPPENHRSGQYTPQDRMSNGRVPGGHREQQQTMSKGVRTENSRAQSGVNSVNGRYSEQQFRGEERRTSHSVVSRGSDNREAVSKVPSKTPLRRPENPSRPSQSLPEKPRKVSQSQPVQNSQKSIRRFPPDERSAGYREQDVQDHSTEDQRYSEEFRNQRSKKPISRHPDAKSSHQENARREQLTNRPHPRDNGSKEQFSRHADAKSSHQQNARREQLTNRPHPRDSGSKEQFSRGQVPVKQEKSFLKGEKRKTLTEDPFRKQVPVNHPKQEYPENAKSNSRKPAHPSRVPPKPAVGGNPNQRVPPQSAKNPFLKPNNLQSKAPLPRSAYQDPPMKGQQRPSSLPRSAHQDSQMKGQQRPSTVPRSGYQNSPSKEQQRPSNLPRSSHQDTPVKSQQRPSAVPRNHDPPMKGQQRPSNHPRSVHEDSPVKGQLRPSKPKQSVPEARREPPRSFKEPEERPRPKLPPIGHIRHKILGPRNPYGKLPSRLPRSYDEEEDDDDDDEMKDFIDDGTNEDCNEDYSKYIRDIFGYDRRRYAFDDDDDDDIMESSFAEQMKEEQRSARIGLLEDLEDIRKEEEEKKMLKKKKK